MPSPETTAAPVGTAHVARLLGCSARTVHRLVQSGVLVPAIIAPGGRKGAYLFRLEDVERLATDRQGAA